MSGTTSDPNDPRLTHGPDTEPVEQAEVYLVLSEEERAKGFTRPYRDSYLHLNCPNGGITAITRMGPAIAETYAVEPNYYGGTYCVWCKMHRPIGEKGEFVWVENGRVTDIKVGT